MNQSDLREVALQRLNRVAGKNLANLECLFTLYISVSQSYVSKSCLVSQLGHFLINDLTQEFITNFEAVRDIYTTS